MAINGTETINDPMNKDGIWTRTRPLSADTRHLAIHSITSSANNRKDFGTAKQPLEKTAKSAFGAIADIM